MGRRLQQRPVTLFPSSAAMLLPELQQGMASGTLLLIVSFLPSPGVAAFEGCCRWAWQCCVYAWAKEAAQQQLAKRDAAERKRAARAARIAEQQQQEQLLLELSPAPRNAPRAMFAIDESHTDSLGRTPSSPACCAACPHSGTARSVATHRRRCPLWQQSAAAAALHAPSA
eukprot:gene49430-39803_t